MPALGIKLTKRIDSYWIAVCLVIYVFIYSFLGAWKWDWSHKWVAGGL